MIIVITPPAPLAGEAATCNALFEQGLLLLHLRKPGAPVATHEAFLREILPVYRSRVVIHDHFELVERFGLKGIHVNARCDALPGYLARYDHVSLSCHALEEVEATDTLPRPPAYLFLGPVFDSISKPGYAAAPFDERRLKKILEKRRQVIALGGITATNLPTCRQLGFAGGALLGHLWEKPEETLDRFARLPAPPALAIAGLDPTAGAGVSSDVKTMESCKTRGLTVCSAITFQNQHAYSGTSWITPADIIRQCETLLRAFTPTVVKIGLVENLPALREIVTYLRAALPAARVIWDPIMKASAGYTFHEQVERETLEEILEKIDLVTPNADELPLLLGDHREETIQATCRARRLAILRKGGHAGGNTSIDRLYLPDGRTYIYTVDRAPGDKHGTGCVLSSAIAAHLARGHALPEACRQAQQHVARYIRSSDTLLGRHDYLPRHAPRDLPLQYITAPRPGVPLPDQVDAACRGGIRWIQLRVKEAPLEEILPAAAAVQRVCRYHGALFIINDRVEVAAALDADGVHLGNEDMDPVEARHILGHHKIIGATCNTLHDIIARARQGVDYIGLGPFAATTTKKRLAPLLGLDGYRRLLPAARAAGVTIPIHAIGGIRLEDIGPLFRAGVSGIAVSSLVNHDDDPPGVARRVLDEIHRHL
ncbi:MAG: thiamine phosphate synthase [Odoribacteraceae bacterium]|jgi:thiamine-phosphate pyrophosphorylase|nr:thiamine phosphate synthase [Odoribacteraceae bacterium]